jgi:hypothetical protein
MTEVMLALAVLLSVIIGVALGLLGGGGSILTLPMLVYVLSVEPKSAIAGSLFVVGLTSLVGVVAHARAGRVRWGVGLPFGAAGMVGAFAGGQLARWVPATLLLVGFAIMMLLTAAAMLRGRGPGGGARRAVPAAQALGLGAAVGLVSGLVGAGGGFLVVPALVLLAGLTMPEAVATSLLVIAMQSLAGFAGHAGHTPIDRPLLALVAGAAVLGSLVGVRLARFFAPETLRRGFGWLVLGMGSFLLTKQLPAGAAQTAAAVVSLGLLSAALSFAVLRAAGRRPAGQVRGGP